MKLAAIALAALAAAAAPKRIPEAPGEVVAPPVVKENDSAPGERRVRPRPFPGAAPVVPHGTADFLPITRDQNACVDCHAVAEKKKGEATPIPASHYIDLRNAPGQRRDEVVGARWNCTACHVPQHDVAPLVKSAFPR